MYDEIYLKALERIYDEIYLIDYDTDYFKVIFQGVFTSPEIAGFTSLKATRKYFLTQLIHEEDATDYRKSWDLKSVIDNSIRGVFKSDFRMLDKNKRYVWIERVLINIDNHKYVCGFSYTDAGKARQLINDRKLDILQNSLSGGVVIAESKKQDFKVNIQYANENIEKFLFFKRGELRKTLKDDVLKLFRSEDIPLLLEQFNEIKHAKIQHFEKEIRVLNKSGAYNWVKIDVNLIDESNESYFFYIAITDIDKIKKSEIDAHVQKEKFELAMDYSNIHYWEYDIKTKFLFRSKSVMRMTGYTQYVENIPESYIESGIIHPNFIIAYRNFYKQISEGVDASLTFKIIKENQEEGWLTINYKVIFDDLGNPMKAIGVGSNLPNQLLQAEQIEYAYGNLQEICNFIVEKFYTDVVVIRLKDKQSVIYYADGKFSNMVFTKNINSLLNVIKKKVYHMDKFRFANIDNLSKIVAKLENTNGLISLSYREETNGKFAWVEKTFTYFNEKKEEILMLSNNIDELVHNEFETRRKLEGDLEQANNANTARQNFLSNMSHEMRTPLNGIKGMLEILKQQSEYQKNMFVENALLSDNHLTGLINDVLDMSKITSGKIALHNSYCDLDALIKQIIAITNPLTQENEICFSYHIVDEGFKNIYCDEKRLKQIVINILSNAFKYSNKKGIVELKIQCKKLTKSRQTIEIEVKDNGIGMSETFLRNAFKPFEQENLSYVTSKGTGLGLTITKNLIDLMNGRIVINSKERIGTNVKITLNFKGSDIDVESVDEKMSLNNNPIFENIRALVVEDNDINAMIEEVLLQGLGISVQSVVNGQEAVNLFEKMPIGYYNIIFMDIMMPVLDGISATKQIRSLKREDAQIIPIVAMTANAFIEDINKSIESGMNYHLSKPFEKADIIRILLKEFNLK